MIAIPNMDKPKFCDGCDLVKYWVNGSFYCKEGIFYPLPCIEFTKWEYTNPGWSRIKIFWLWYVIGWGLFTAEKEEEDG